VAEHGNLELALYGSFLPVPQVRLKADTTGNQVVSGLGNQAVSGFSRTATPGEILTAPGQITANTDRRTLNLDVTNTGDRPIQVGSHYHFVETNAALTFDRKGAYGMRLDIPAGTAVRFEPGETKTVSLVAIAGNRAIKGGN